jgi:hypothetical protein
MEGARGDNIQVAGSSRPKSGRRQTILICVLVLLLSADIALFLFGNLSRNSFVEGIEIYTGAHVIHTTDRKVHLIDPERLISYASADVSFDDSSGAKNQIRVTPKGVGYKSNFYLVVGENGVLNLERKDFGDRLYNTTPDIQLVNEMLSTDKDVLTDAIQRHQRKPNEWNYSILKEAARDYVQKGHTFDRRTYIVNGSGIKMSLILFCICTGSIVIIAGLYLYRKLVQSTGLSTKLVTQV